MAIGGRDDQTVHEYLLKADQYMGELKKVAKAIKQEQRDEKDLELVRKQLGDTTDKTASSFSTWSDNLAKSITVGNLAFLGIQKLASGFGELAKEVNQYTQVSNIYQGDLEAARRATQGLVSDLDIMAAKNQLMTLGVKLSDAEFTKMLGSLVKISSSMNKDLKYSLESAVTMLSRQSTAVADNVGVVIKAEEAQRKYAEAIGKTANQLTDAEKKLAFNKDALEQVTRKAESLAPRVKTLGDDFEKLGTKIKNTTMRLGSWINENMALTGEGRTEYVLEYAKAMNAGLSEQDFLFKRLEKSGAEYVKTLDAIASASGLMAFGGAKGASKSDLAAYGGQSSSGGSESGSEFDLMKRHESFIPGGKWEVYGGGGPAKKRGATKASPDTGYWDDALYNAMKGAAEEYGRYVTAGKQLWQDIRKAQGAKTVGDVDRDDSKGWGSANNEWETWQKSTKAAWAHADALANVKDKSMEMAEANYASVQQMEAGWDNIQSSGTKVMGEFAGSIWSAADAAIMGSESFGMAMAKMLKSTLLSIAVESTIKAVFNLAEAAAHWMNPVAVAKHLTAAALFGSVAVTAGAAGLAVSAGIGAAGGYDSASRSSSSAKSGTGTNSYKPSFGTQKENTAPININVYVGDKGNPSTAMLLTKQIDSQLKVAA